MEKYPKSLQCQLSYTFQEDAPVFWWLLLYNSIPYIEQTYGNSIYSEPADTPRYKI